MSLLRSLLSTGLVSSGSGLPLVPPSNVPASQFSQGNLNPEQAPLVGTNTTLTTTRRATISKDQLVRADREYVTAINNLSQFWARNETDTFEYFDAKSRALAAQRRWELARDGLEEVAISDRGDQREGFVSTGNSTVPRNARDAGGTDDLLQGGGSVADLLARGAGIAGENDLEASGEGGFVSEDSIDPDQLENEILVNGDRFDPRIKVRIKADTDGDGNSFYGDEESILYLLKETNGVIFPYTPTIATSHLANYETMSPTHANTDYQIYTRSPSVKISITGMFTAQNTQEAQYMLASMHFFRTVTKMRFGIEDENRGLPPPMLVLSGYGNYMFKDLDVIATEFSMEMPSNVDYVEVLYGDAYTWVPSVTNFNVSLVVQTTPKKQRDDFNFDAFASGRLLRDGKGWI